uniref:Uncharacterized protein n=1 Tax=Rhizophagus irregularis (strain DAOM 181602 / DAOM 197198 / MUCL 43194) TaxID=747089 RepID=U9TGX6_RHIID
MNVKKIISEDCYIKFIVKPDNRQKEHMLKYKDVSKLEGLGWIEYELFWGLVNFQLSIEVYSVDMINLLSE